jgi:hypothetical protein
MVIGGDPKAAYERRDQRLVWQVAHRANVSRKLEDRRFEAQNASSEPGLCIKQNSSFPGVSRGVGESQSGI